MTLPALPEFEGIPPEYQQARWVPNSAWGQDYAGGGLWSGTGLGQHYDVAELERLWLDAGGTTAEAPGMAAIAENAESGGDAGDWNSSGATGLWQIEWPSNYAGPRQDLFTPLVNARAALRLFRRYGFSPWGHDPHPDLGIPPAPPGSVPAENKAVPGASTGVSATVPGGPSGPQVRIGPFGVGPGAGFLSGLNPLSGLDTTLTRLAVLVPVILAAAAIGVLGLYRATAPARQRLEDRAEENAAQAAQIAQVAAL